MVKKGFVLFPDRGFMNKCVDVNKNIRTSQIVLDTTVSVPHISLFGAGFSQNFDGREIVDRLADSEMFRHESHGLIGVNVVNNNGFVMIPVVPVERWKNINRLIFGWVKNFLVLPDRGLVNGGWGVEEQNSFILSGFRFNLDAYFPHVTVGYDSQELDSVAGRGLFSSVCATDFRLASLAYVEYGKFGVVNRVLFERALPFKWD